MFMSFYCTTVKGIFLLIVPAFRNVSTSKAWLPRNMAIVFIVREYSLQLVFLPWKKHGLSCKWENSENKHSSQKNKKDQGNYSYIFHLPLVLIQQSLAWRFRISIWVSRRACPRPSCTDWENTTSSSLRITWTGPNGQYLREMQECLR